MHKARWADEDGRASLNPLLSEAVFSIGYGNEGAVSALRES